ncbi:unnamed protein product [Cuscuta europaea]|uniref:Uncharacterized protein n=1 Tax=Cuscuta europaea TaxID=41803 RepID=A0A9P1A106_CUSEU|nr:unnamed protein product [Cuscuta europaea]
MPHMHRSRFSIEDALPRDGVFDVQKPTDRLGHRLFCTPFCIWIYCAFSAFVLCGKEEYHHVFICFPSGSTASEDQSFFFFERSEDQSLFSLKLFRNTFFLFCSTVNSTGWVCKPSINLLLVYVEKICL